jgi:hypothetical protein
VMAAGEWQVGVRSHRVRKTNFHLCRLGRKPRRPTALIARIARRITRAGRGADDIGLANAKNDGASGSTATEKGEQHD